MAALSGPNEFAEFYGRLRSLKDYHRKFPNEVQLTELMKVIILIVTTFTLALSIAYSEIYCVTCSTASF